MILILWHRCQNVDHRLCIKIWLCLPAAVVVALHLQPIQALAADSGHQHSGHRELGHLENMARAHHYLRAKPRGLRPKCLGRVPGCLVQGQHDPFMHCVLYWLMHWMVSCLMHSSCILVMLCQSVFMSKCVCTTCHGAAPAVLCKYLLVVSCHMQSLKHRGICRVHSMLFSAERHYLNASLARKKMSSLSLSQAHITCIAAHLRSNYAGCWSADCIKSHASTSIFLACHKAVLCW